MLNPKKTSVSVGVLKVIIEMFSANMTIVHYEIKSESMIGSFELMSGKK